MSHRLLRLRLALELTQAEAATRCGVGRNTWRAWETAGNWNPDKLPFLLPGLPFIGWVADGTWTSALGLCEALEAEQDLATDGKWTLPFHTYLLPEVGREIQIVCHVGDQYWWPVTAIKADRGILYATAAGDVEPSSVLGVRPPSPTAVRVSGAAGEVGTSTPSGPSPIGEDDSLTGPDGTLKEPR